LPFKAVIFDMDGVLADTEPLHYAAVNRVLAEHGVTLPWAEYEPFIGTSNSLWGWLKQRFALPHSNDHYAMRFWEELLVVLPQELLPDPGTATLLQGLRGYGLKLGLASSSQRSCVDATLSALGLEDAFEVIVSGDMIENGKPAPDIFLLAAERLRVLPDQSLVVEDSPHGIAAAKAAGMTVVALRTPYIREGDIREADLIVDNLEQIRLALLAETVA